MLRRLCLRVLRRARWASVRASWVGARHQPADSASDARFRAASSMRATRSGLDQSPSTYASPSPVSPFTRARTRARESWIRISPRRADWALPNTRRDPSGSTTTRQPVRIRSAAASPIRCATPARIGSAAPGRFRAACRSLIEAPPPGFAARPRRGAWPPRDDGSGPHDARAARRAGGSPRSSSGSRTGGEPASGRSPGR